MTENLPNSSENQQNFENTVGLEPELREDLAAGDLADDLSPWQNFGFGFITGALLAFVGFSISIDMTHTALSDVGWGMWVGAIALPLLLGTLSILLKQPFIKALDTVMRVLPY